jgi:hypothetical protein
MSEISKQALKVDNSTSFPNNTTGYISPTILRAFNINMIDSLVDEIGYNADSASWNISIGQLNTYTASFAPSLTQLNAFTASQLTINTGVNGFTQSAGSSITQLNQATASLQNFTSSINQILVNGSSIGTSTRLFFNGFVSASIIPNVDGAIASITVLSDPSKLDSSSFNQYTASTAATQSVFSASVATSISSSSATFTTFSQSQNSFNLSATASIVELLNLSSSLSGGYATQGELDASSSTLQNNINVSASVLQGNINVLSSFTGSYATTGSNVFTGDQTLIDNANNFFTISDASGSMLLVAKGYTSSSLHLSSSISTVGSGSLNLIFKTNNNTADTIISGSGNIFTNPVAGPAGFKRYLTSNNIALGAGFASISESMQFSPAVNNNYFAAGGLTMRGPVSASSWSIANNNLLGNINIGTAAGVNSADKLTSTLLMNGNYVAGTLSVIVGVTALTASTVTITNNNVNGSIGLSLNQSAVNFTGNSVNDGAFGLNNNFFSSSAGLGLVTIQRNTIAGNTNTFTITGSVQATTTAQPQFNDNLVGGANNTIFSDYSTSRISGLSTYGNFHRSIVYGNTLIVTASMSAGEANTQGSAFFGRYNVNDGIRNKSDYAVFAVGTGNATTRKTGFLIDSGSNSFFEGTVTTSGSVYGNVVSMTIASNTASMDLRQGNFFSLTLVSGSTTHLTATNIRPGQTVNLLLTQPSVGTGSVSYNSTFDFPAGANYIATPVTSSKDILSLITFDSSILYATSINNLA